MTGSLRSCVCVTLWATTKARPFSCCRITVGEKKRGGAWWRRGDFRESEREKKRGSGFWNRPGADVQGRRIRLRVLVTFTRLDSPSIVAFCGSQQPRDGKLPAGVPTVLNVRPTMVERTPPPPHHHHQTYPSLPTATPHTEDVMGELMPATVRLCVLIVDEQPVHTLTLWGP